MRNLGWHTKRLDAHGDFDKGLAILTHPALPGLMVFVTPDRATLHNIRGDYIMEYHDDVLKNPPASHVSKCDMKAVAA